MPTKPLLPVAGLTPESAASTSTSVDPFAAFPEAQSAVSTDTLMPSFSQTPEGQGKAAPLPETPSAPDAFEGFPEAETPGAPAADAFDAFPTVSGVKGYDLAKLKATDTATLAKDKAEFNPVEFLAKNEEALLADPAALQKVQDAYAEREKEKMTAGQFAKAVLTAPFHPLKSGATVGKAIAGVPHFLGELLSAGGKVVANVGSAAGAASAGDKGETAARLAEVADAFGAATQRWTNLLDTKLTGEPTNIRERMFRDSEYKKKEIEAAAGNSDFSKMVGTSAEELGKLGIVVHPEAVQKMETITDPLFLVPIGAGIGVVSKSGQFLLAKATSEAAAKTFAELGNAILERSVGGAVEGATKAAGTGIEKIGALATKLNELAKTVPFTGTTTGTIKLGAKVASVLGKGAEAVGRGIQAAAPVAGVVGTEAFKGAAEAGALSVPLFIGSTPEEREGLLSMVAAGGVLRGGGAALGVGANVAGRAAQNKLAAKIFEAADRGPVVDSPYYGTDPKLDQAHAEHQSKLTPGQQSVLNWTREFFRDAGIEVYSVDNNTFQNHVPQVGGASAAEGFFAHRGERINPDGTRQPVIQLLLNGDTNGLGHELYHAFKSLAPEQARALESHIEKTWHPVEQQWISDQYNAALNGGKPRSQWEVQLNKKQILEEAAAEVFGRTFDATDLSGVSPSVQKRAALFAASALEKMGFPLAGKGLPAGPGVSALGIRPSTSEHKISQEYLKNLAQRVEDGTLAPARPVRKPIIAGELTPGTIQKRPAAPRQSTPPEIVPAPATPRPATPPTAPVAPAVPNIRVTPKEQLDYAAQRSQVTNAEQALADAPEEAQKHVQSINSALEAGHGVEIVHKGVIREGGPTPEKPVARGERRSEQEAAYVAEALGAVPDAVREQHQKVLFPTRWQKTGKSGTQLTARSLDKALANVKNAVDMSVKAGEPIPYDLAPDGKLSDAGWNEVVQDLKDYWANQDRGFRGDGETLVRPKEDIGVSLPPEDPRGAVAKISSDRTDFLNLIQGLNIPGSVTRQLKGKIPGNVKGQLLAELQGKTPAKPLALTPEMIGKQAYKAIEGVPGLREILEVNPLRNRLREAGAPIGDLIEVTENINLKDIESVTPRPDVPGRGGSTDITRAGFSVKAPEFKSELDRVVKGESQGETFNLDGTIFKPGERKLDVVTLASENFEPSKLTPEAVQAFVNKHPEATKNPDAKVGLFKLSDGRISADLNVVVDQAHRKNTEAFARANNQEAIFDLVKNEVVPTGGNGETVIRSPEEVASAAKALVGGKPASKAPTIEEGESILKQTPEEWAKTTSDWGDRGSLTGAAYDLGLGLTDRADLNKLQDLQKRAGDAGKEAMDRGDFETAMADITKSQFFREAWEAAQGIGSAKVGLKLNKRLADTKPPFPELEGKFSPAREFPDESDPIEKAAIRTAGGNVVTGSWHGEAMLNLADAIAKGEIKETLPPGVSSLTDFLDTVMEGGAPAGFVEDGFVTRSGKFLNRVEALDHAEKIKQLKPSEGRKNRGGFSEAGVLESTEFEGRRAFSVASEAGSSSKGKTEAKAAWEKKGTKSPFFKKWFGDSQVLDGSQPRIVYHSTQEDFGTFNTKINAKEWGSHFGESEQASAVSRRQGGGKILRGYLRIENPVFTTDWGNRWHTQEAIDSILKDAGEDPQHGINTPEKAVEFLTKQGYDGLIYKNRYEIDPEALSYVSENSGVMNTVELSDREFESILELEGYPKLEDSYTIFNPEQFKIDAPTSTREFSEKPEFAFSPKKSVRVEDLKPLETEAQARKRIAATDYSKYEVPTPKRPSKEQSPTGWILPNGERVALDSKGAYHEQYLAGNADKLNKQFGTDFSKTENIDDRLQALNKGFVRMRYNPNQGAMHVEANVDSWPKVKKSVLSQLANHEDNIDSLHVSLLNKEGQVVDNVSERLGDVEPAEKFGRIEDAVNGLRGAAGKFSVKPEGEQKKFDVSWKPKERGIVQFRQSVTAASAEEAASKVVPAGAHLVSAEEHITDLGIQTDLLKSLEKKAMTEGSFSAKPTEQEFVRAKIAESRKFPEAKPLVFKKDKTTGDFVLSNGKPLPVVETYDFPNTPLAKEVGKGIKDPVKREEAYTDALSDRLVREYKNAAKDPAIKAGETWYSTCREKLKALLGEDTKLFAELLGATSARTAVDLNFGFALEAYNQFKSGAYTDLLAKYREGKLAYDNNDPKALAEYADATNDPLPNRSQFLDWWIEKNNLTPMQSTGKRFGMNSRAVLKVLDGSWMAEVKGPKTPNFTGNLTGSSFEATVDVWAARMLHRLSNEGNIGKWRIQPGNETGVIDSDFFIGQKAFRKAADKVGLQPDALQAILWFAEKNHWEKKGWTGAIGAAKSDFNTLLARSERTPEGGILLRRKPSTTVASELNLGDVRTMKKTSGKELGGWRH